MNPNIKKDFEKLINESASNLSTLALLPYGNSRVNNVLKKLYQELGFSEEGFFPVFRCRIDNDVLTILNVAPNFDVTKLLMGQEYVVDRFQSNIIKIGSRISSLKDSKILKDNNLEINIDYQLVSYKIQNKKEIENSLMDTLLDGKTKLLTYELFKQLHFKLQMPPTKFDTCGNCIISLYQPVFYCWLNQSI